MIGNTLGNYRILKQIGEGGMGTVYLARDLTLEREVALKIISPELARNPVLMNRFRVEAIAQAKLNHNNIVTIHAFDQENDTYFFAMEHVDGTTLKALIREEGPIPVNQALKIFSQVLDGMGYAHAKGVVHRDIKPSNIFLDTHHTAKIGDFGIAKVEGIDGLTRVGTGIGSPMYSSPEQLMGKPTDMRSDIYSLGMTLYEMLTGTPPVKVGGTGGLENISQAVQAEPPSTTAINPKIPDPVDKVVMKSIDKKPGRRYQSVKEFKRAIAELLSPITPVPETTGQSKTNKKTETGKSRFPIKPPSLNLQGLKLKKLNLPKFDLKKFDLKKLNLKRINTGHDKKLLGVAAVLAIILIVLVAYILISEVGASQSQTIAGTNKQQVNQSTHRPASEMPRIQQPTPTSPSTPPPSTLPPSTLPPSTLPPTTSPSTPSTSSPKKPGSITVSSTIATLKNLIRSKSYKKAVAVGNKAIDAGLIDGEIYLKIAQAYYYDGKKPQAAIYYDKALEASKQISFPSKYRYTKKKYIRGTLTISRETLSFTPRNATSARTRFFLPLSQVRSVSDDIGTDLTDIFKKKKNKKNPVLIIKDRNKNKYSIQLTQNDNKLRGFIKHIINILRKT
jgi:serine/threonine protein kinase